jgi:hypothetical protein
MGYTIAIAGKGGIGKSTIAGLIIRLIKEKKIGSVLGVDADPNSNLAEFLGIKPGKSIGEVLDEISAGKDKIPAGMTKDRFIEYQAKGVPHVHGRRWCRVSADADGMPQLAGLLVPRQDQDCRPGEPAGSQLGLDLALQRVLSAALEMPRRDERGPAAPSPRSAFRTQYRQDPLLERMREIAQLREITETGNSHLELANPAFHWRAAQPTHRLLGLVA